MSILRVESRPFPIELVHDRFDLVLWIVRTLPDVRLAQEAEEHRRRQVVPQRSFADLHPPTKCRSILVGLDDRIHGQSSAYC